MNKFLFTTSIAAVSLSTRLIVVGIAKRSMASDWSPPAKIESLFAATAGHYLSIYLLSYQQLIIINDDDANNTDNDGIFCIITIIIIFVRYLKLLLNDLQFITMS